MYQNEHRLWAEGHRFIAGCDEVGRGPLAGPVVAAAVVLDSTLMIDGLNDSKKLSEKKRIELDRIIRELAVSYKITYIWPEEIDQINIYQASKKAMMVSIQQLSVTPTYILSDAMPMPELEIPYEAIIKGDQKSATIAAASILAKVERDRYMVEMDTLYPGYGFAKHKGYPTKEHLTQLKERGITPIHRKTYGPVRDVLLTQLSLDI